MPSITSDLDGCLAELGAAARCHLTTEQTGRAREAFAAYLARGGWDARDAAGRADLLRPIYFRAALPATVRRAVGMPVTRADGGGLPPLPPTPGLEDAWRALRTGEGAARAEAVMARDPGAVAELGDRAGLLREQIRVLEHAAAAEPAPLRERQLAYLGVATGLPAHASRAVRIFCGLAPGTRPGELPEHVIDFLPPALSALAYDALVLAAGGDAPSAWRRLGRAVAGWNALVAYLERHWAPPAASLVEAMGAARDDLDAALGEAQGQVELPALLPLPARPAPAATPPPADPQADGGPAAAPAGASAPTATMAARLDRWRVDLGRHPPLDAVTDAPSALVAWVNAIAAGHARGDLEALREPLCAVLEGPPGGGKTFLAKSIAARLGIAMVAPGSDLFDRHVNQSSTNVADLFAAVQAEAHAAGGLAMIFFDELDGRLGSGENASDEDVKVRQEIQMVLSGARSRAYRGVMVLAATNAPMRLGAALLDRVSRFVVPAPTAHQIAAQIAAVLTYYFPDAGALAPHGGGALADDDGALLRLSHLAQGAGRRDIDRAVSRLRLQHGRAHAPTEAEVRAGLVELVRCRQPPAQRHALPGGRQRVTVRLNLPLLAGPFAVPDARLVFGEGEQSFAFAWSGGSPATAAGLHVDSLGPASLALASLSLAVPACHGDPPLQLGAAFAAWHPDQGSWHVAAGGLPRFGLTLPLDGPELAAHLGEGPTFAATLTLELIPAGRPAYTLFDLGPAPGAVAAAAPLQGTCLRHALVGLPGGTVSSCFDASGAAIAASLTLTAAEAQDLMCRFIVTPAPGAALGAATTFVGTVGAGQRAAHMTAGRRADSVTLLLDVTDRLRPERLFLLVGPEGPDVGIVDTLLSHLEGGAARAVTAAP